jgi:uncharacterized LabA/DUF88 family protein
LNIPLPAEPAAKFKPQTARLEKLIKDFPYVETELGKFLYGRSRIYLDYGNMRPWSTKLNWNVGLKRLRQLLDCFEGEKQITCYYGTLDSDPDSVALIDEMKALKLTVKTKPVKRIRVSIDASSIAPDAPDILRNLIKNSLLQTLSLTQVQELNAHLKSLNKNGTRFFEELKCNFDVEISTDMLLDHMVNGVENFLLFSCDGDFADTISQLLKAGKRVVVFGTAGQFAKEFNELRNAGLILYEVKKLKEFICWPRFLDPKYK